MRLLELEPQWLPGRVGFVFRSPTNRNMWQSCFAEPPRLGEQIRLFEELLGDHRIVQPCKPSARWTITGDDFASISVTPSLNGEAGGLWHGFITDGEIVGGV